MGMNGRQRYCAAKWEQKDKLRNYRAPVSQAVLAGTRCDTLKQNSLHKAGC